VAIGAGLAGMTEYELATGIDKARRELNALLIIAADSVLVTRTVVVERRSMTSPHEVVYVDISCRIDAFYQTAETEVAA